MKLYDVIPCTTGGITVSSGRSYKFMRRGIIEEITPKNDDYAFKTRIIGDSEYRYEDDSNKNLAYSVTMEIEEALDLMESRIKRGSATDRTALNAILVERKIGSEILSEKTGIPKQTINRIRNGSLKPSNEEMKTIAAVLGVQIKDITGLRP